MQWIKLIAVVMLVWGNLASAALTVAGDNSRQELQSITSWMARLNSQYTDLDVTVAPAIDLADPTDRQQLLRELQALSFDLSGQTPLPANSSLMTVDCNRPVCTGGK